MSATLTKAPRTGTQAARTASVELPAAVNPAKKRLAEVLTAYDKAGLDLADARGHLSRSELDEAAALDSMASDSEDRIAVAIRSKAIYSARVTSREAAQVKLLKEVKTALTAAHSGYSILARELLSKRRELFRSRLIEAGQLVGNFMADLDDLLQSCGPIQVVRRLEINSQALLYLDTAEQIAGMAARVLESYGKLETEQGKQL
jgi:hypothetical protein